MAKYNIYGPFAGVKDGLTLLTLLQDKKKLKEIMGVIKALEDERQALNEAIEVYGKAKKMDGLLMSAEMKDREAASALAAAKESAGGIQKDAKTWANDLRGKLVTREKMLEASAKILADGENRLKADTDAWKAALAETQVGIAEREKRTLGLLDEAEVLKNRYAAALANMKADAAAA